MIAAIAPVPSQSARPAQSDTRSITLWLMRDIPELRSFPLWRSLYVYCRDECARRWQENGHSDGNSVCSGLLFRRAVHDAHLCETLPCTSAGTSTLRFSPKTAFILTRAADQPRPLATQALPLPQVVRYALLQA